MRLVAIKPRAHWGLSLVAAALLAAALVIVQAATPLPTVALIPAASAACPSAEVVFARGREEPPGVGAVGDAFVNSLRAKVPMSVGVYGVNYPANISTGSGANDMSAHVQSMARSCPNTREVLGGYSLGAEVADLVTGGRAGFGFTNLLPPGMDQHIAAVALFGNGTRGVAPAFAGKTIDQCASGDPICGGGLNWSAHLQPSYIGSGLVDQAASFVVDKL
jgi:cutinase